jgi:hypothetical protein
MGQPSQLLSHGNHQLHNYKVVGESSASPKISWFVLLFTFRNHYQQEYIYNLLYNHSPISIVKSEWTCKIHHACL